ncbi:MAG TPA: T9SS type A sorting domain-containing protein [bacterium]|nr:T9SS type A sorting domain-containing protein [bacterium]HPN46178.1 T9SS type A sorting domain-containing protein [bacterium]
MKLLRFCILITFLTLTATETWALGVQGHYRWRNDNGNETSATWKEAEDGATSEGPGYNFRLRIELYNLSAETAYNATLKLSYSTDESNWIDITTDGSTNAFKLAPSSNFTDGDAVTDQLTNSNGGVHNGGQMIESSNTFAVSLPLSASLEFEWCLQATANAVHGTTYYFIMRESDNDGIPVDRNPRLVYDQALPVALAAFTAHQQGKNVLLNWTTASETDNLGFILERRANQANWQTIASYQTEAALQGKGNSTTNTNYTFTDTRAPQNAACEYRLADVDIHGAVAQIGSTQLNVTAIPTAFVLEPAYPNPFNPSTNIRFHLAQDGLVKLTVMDMLGRTVKTIDNTWLPAGSYSRTWNAVTDNNQPVPSGVYFFCLETANTNLVQKAVLIR